MSNQDELMLILPIFQLLFAHSQINCFRLWINSSSALVDLEHICCFMGRLLDPFAWGLLHLTIVTADEILGCYDVIVLGVQYEYFDSAVSHPKCHQYSRITNSHTVESIHIIK
jgi:hypothetical protein